MPELTHSHKTAGLQGLYLIAAPPATPLLYTPLYLGHGARWYNESKERKRKEHQYVMQRHD